MYSNRSFGEAENGPSFSDHLRAEKETAEEQVDDGNFTNVSLGEPVENSPKKQKVPRKVLYFSDGTLEEYSTDEEDEIELAKPPQVDPATLTWLPWIWYYIASTAARALSAADFCGEKLAWFFGITSPKYQYAIDEYNRQKTEEEEEQAALAREREAMRLRVTGTLAGAESGGSGIEGGGPVEFSEIPPDTPIVVDMSVSEKGSANASPQQRY